LSHSKAPIRLDRIVQGIDDIFFILDSKDIKVTQALEDLLIKPAIRMHIITIAEEFNRLKDENEFDVLKQFEPDDLRGIAAVRNFIAHDYDSVDDAIIEDVIRTDLPRLRERALFAKKIFQDRDAHETYE